MVLQVVGHRGLLPPFAPETGPGAEIASLRDHLEQQARLIDRQADHIDLLERMLTPPGKRGRARLRRSTWWRRATQWLRATVAQ